MTVRLAHIFRHPVKAHGREELARVALTARRCLPFDRHWAVAHDLSHFDPDAHIWMPCANFQRGARTPSLMAITARFDEERAELTLNHPDLPELRFHPETEGARLIEWLAPISPTERFRPRRLVRAPGVAMTDTDFPSISIQNLASNAAMSAHLERELSIHRWRANLWLDGLDPWEERGWIGHHLRIGDTVLHVREAIGRCKATAADPSTGRIDTDTLKGLREVLGCEDFGVYAVVVEGGAIARGDRVEIL